jgi:hypothetical protein
VEATIWLSSDIGISTFWRSAKGDDTTAPAAIELDWALGSGLRL